VKPVIHQQVQRKRLSQVADDIEGRPVAAVGARAGLGRIQQLVDDSGDARTQRLDLRRIDQRRDGSALTVVLGPVIKRNQSSKMYRNRAQVVAVCGHVRGVVRPEELADAGYGVQVHSVPCPPRPTQGFSHWIAENIARYVVVAVFSGRALQVSRERYARPHRAATGEESRDAGGHVI
jgi:hypothetical protein